METNNLDWLNLKDKDPNWVGERKRPEIDPIAIAEEIEFLILSNKSKIKELKHQLQKMTDQISELKNRMVISPKEIWALEMIVEQIKTQQIAIEKQIKRYMWDDIPNDQKTELDIGRAKAVPITDLIEFNRAGFAKCLWHSPDKNPSMHYVKKTNRVFCFSCGQGGDGIDAMMVKDNIDFQTAIKKLTNN